MDDDEIHEQIGQRLLRRRKSLGLSQPDVANRIGSSQGRVSEWERGERWFGVRTLYHLADVLDCTVHDLLPPRAEN